MEYKMECHLKWYVTQIGMSLELERHLNWNVTQSGMSVKLEYHSNWILLKLEDYIDWKGCNS